MRDNTNTFFHASMSKVVGLYNNLGWFVFTEIQLSEFIPRNKKLAQNL